MKIYENIEDSEGEIPEAPGHTKDSSEQSLSIRPTQRESNGGASKPKTDNNNHRRNVTGKYYGIHVFCVIHL